MTLFNYVNGVFLLLLVIVCILPILHVIALSLSERIEAVAGNVTFYPIGFTSGSLPLCYGGQPVLDLPARDPDPCSHRRTGQHFVWS